MNEALEKMVTLFKALSDSTRLRMVGLLAERERCGQELAAELRVSPATVSHHLKLLRRAGLISESRKQPYTFYALDHTVLGDAVRQLGNTDQVTQLAAGTGLPDDKRKVLRTFFDGPRLVAIPAQRKKKEIVFEEILRRLPRRKEYPEKDLSRFIEAIHPDFCTIRREFVMGRYMDRERGIYRLTDKGRQAIAEGR